MFVSSRRFRLTGNNVNVIMCVGHRSPQTSSRAAPHRSENSKLSQNKNKRGEAAAPLSVRIDCCMQCSFQLPPPGDIQRCPKRTVIMCAARKRKKETNKQRKKAVLTNLKRNNATQSQRKRLLRSLAELMHPTRAQSSAVGSIATLPANSPTRIGSVQQHTAAIP